VQTDSPKSVLNGSAWWRELTDAGGEGMVVKPLANLTRGGKGLVQPGIKVRDRETCGSSMARTTPNQPTWSGCGSANLGHKQSLALRENALGSESLPAGPGSRCGGCTKRIAVPAMEAEPVDPRL